MKKHVIFASIITLFIYITTSCTIKIKTNDNALFQYQSIQEIEALEESKLIKGIMEVEVAKDEPIPLPLINSKTFEQVFEYLNLLHQYRGLLGEEQKEIMQTIEGKLNKLDRADLAQLIYTIDYLDIPILLDKTIEIWVKRDFSPEGLSKFEQSDHDSIENFFNNTAVIDKLTKTASNLVNISYLKNSPLIKEKKKLGPAVFLSDLYLSPNGKKFAVRRKKQLSIWDTQKQTKIHEITVDENIKKIKFTPDGEYICWIDKKNPTIVYFCNENNDPEAKINIENEKNSKIENFYFCLNGQYMMLHVSNKHFMSNAQLINLESLASIPLSHNFVYCKPSFGLNGIFSRGNEIFLRSFIADRYKSIKKSKDYGVRKFAIDTPEKKIITLEESNDISKNACIGIYDIEELLVLKNIKLPKPDEDIRFPQRKLFIPIDNDFFIVRHGNLIFLMHKKEGAIVKEINTSDPNCPITTECIHLDENNLTIRVLKIARDENYDHCLYTDIWSFAHDPNLLKNLSYKQMQLFGLVLQRIAANKPIAGNDNLQKIYYDMPSKVQKYLGENYRGKVRNEGSITIKPISLASLIKTNMGKKLLSHCVIGGALVGISSYLALQHLKK